jgi:hypothetical protein
MKNNKEKCILLLLFHICLLFFVGCYSFTGGSIPSHLKTLQINSVTDQSGFGNPNYKIDLETEITNNFMKDNSFELADNVGDAKLTVTISSITETTNTVGTSELETERRLTVNCSAEYYDNVMKKQIWQKSFSSYGLFDVNSAFTARNETMQIILKQVAEDIMLAVVSGW